MSRVAVFDEFYDYGSFSASEYYIFAAGNSMKTLSIVIPVYNEEQRLDKTFEALLKLQVPRGLKLEKIIFVDDGSSDNSVANLKSQIPILKNRMEVDVKIISYQTNKGKGYAVARGMKESTSDYTLFCDADISTKFSEVRKFMPDIRKGMPIIIGTRKNGHSTVIRHQPFVREMLGRVFTLFSAMVLNTWATDFTCGFKAFSREAKDSLFPKLKIRRWSFDAEVIFLSRISGFEFAEVPVVWSDDRRSKVNLFKDVPGSIRDILTIRTNDLINVYRTRELFFFPKWAREYVNTVKLLIF
jgi:dolichyl-phosphate beta-glucosyltransferase